MKKLVLFSYFFIYFVWGANFLATHYAIQDLPPITMVGSRFAIAGVILFIIGMFRERRLPNWSTARPAILQGFFLNVLGGTPAVWAQQYVPSGLTSILITIVPLWTVFLDGENRRSNLRNPWILLGLVLGMLGVVLLTRNGSFRPVEVSMQNYMIGLLVILFGSFFWAYGAIFVKKKKHTGGLFMNVAIQLFFAGIVQLCIGGLAGEFQHVNIAGMHWQVVLSMLHLILLSSVIGYVCYIWLLRQRSATEVGTHTFVNPIVAVTLGVLLAGEPFTFTLVAALLLVLVSVFLVRYHYLLGSKARTKPLGGVGS